MVTSEPANPSKRSQEDAGGPSAADTVLYTDGSCIRNPGPGAWACVIRTDGATRELFGSETHTTNNRMELRAAIEGLNALDGSARVAVFTDSQYLKNGITRWLRRWKTNGWKRSVSGESQRQVLNRDLWEKLDAAASRHSVRWHWVRGHADHAANNRAHDLASAAARTAGGPGPRGQG